MLASLRPGKMWPSAARTFALNAALALLISLLTPGAVARAQTPPGSPFPETSDLNDQKPGSILVYNFFSSSISNPNLENTEISLTNTNTTMAVTVRLFLIDGTSSAAGNFLFSLAPRQTVSRLASSLQPGGSGYAMAVAIDSVTGCPINFNHLIGDAYIKLSTGQTAGLQAVAVAAIAAAPASCAGSSTDLSFDGVNYNKLPRVEVMNNISSRADGNDTIFILNRIGGDLRTSATALGNIFGLIYDDAENLFSFTFAGSGSQFRRVMSNSSDFPRTAPRFETVIPAGRSGWMKVFNGSLDVAILGASLNFNPNSGSQQSSFITGQNLTHRTVTTGATTLTIPVGCLPVFAPLSQAFPPEGGSGSVNLSIGAGCLWAAASNAPWISITAGSSGTGAGTISYSVAANPNPDLRTGTMTIAGATYLVEQAATGVLILTDFTGGIPADWMVGDGGMGGGAAATWTTANPCNRVIPAPFSGLFAIVDSNCAGAGATQNEELITPPFNATGMSQVTLQFHNQFHWLPGGLNEIGDVDVSTNDGVTWTNLLRLQGGEDGFPTPNTKTINLTSAIAANPANVRIRFHYYTPDALSPNQSLRRSGQPVVSHSPTSQELWWAIDRAIIAGFNISPTSLSIGNIGGSGAVNVTAGVGVPWLAQSNVSWISLSTSGGTGSGPVGYVVAANTGPQRTGAMTIANNTFPVTQAGCPTITVNPATADNGFVGAAYSQAFTNTGGAGAITWSVSAGALPGGLLLNTSTGVLSGTPAIGGNFNFTIRATDANGCFGERNFTVLIGGSGLQYFPLPRPIRLLDTRTGATGCFTPGSPLQGGTPKTQQARITCDGVTIPGNAAAVVGNATVVNFLSSGGFITLWPNGAAQPTVSNLNYSSNQIIPNAFTVGLGANGEFKIFASASTDFIVDITGYYAPPGTGGLYYHPLPNPIRLLDTRTGATGCTTPGLPLQGGAALTQNARLTCNGVTIPSNAQAVVGNATVVNFQSAGGFITLFPTGATQPTVSNLNYLSNQIIPNAFTVGLGSAGSFEIFASGSTDFITDITGYYSSDPAPDANGVAGLLYNPLPSPIRLLDTRPSAPACTAPGAPLQAGVPLTQQARVTCNSVTIPANAQAIVGNGTVVNFISGGGFITLWPTGATQPTVSNLNYSSNQIIPNAFTVGLGANGEFNIFASSATDFIADVTGYFAP